MKINPNVLAATILGASIIIAVKIYCITPKEGRYTYREKQEELFLETLVFDTATGTQYSQFVSKDRPTTWSIVTIDDIKLAVQRQRKQYQ